MSRTWWSSWHHRMRAMSRAKRTTCVAEYCHIEPTEESIMRDVAYWPKTFLDEIESAPVTSPALLRSLGGPSFLYRTPQTAIWIDPYFYGTPDDAVPDAYRATAIPVKPDEARLA